MSYTTEYHRSRCVHYITINSQFRSTGESVSTFKRELRSLAEFGNFEGTQVMLRDRLMCGINH